MSKVDLNQITKNILSAMPSQTLLNEEDIKVLKRNKDFIFSLAGVIVKDFYDVLYSNEKTRAVFKPGEREIREKSLTSWMIKTIEGNFDLPYWSWQTFVGILHVKRKVTNNMMISMMGRVSDIIFTQAILQLPKDEAIALKTAWIKLSTTTLSLIAEAYHIFYMTAVSNVTGMNQKLLNNAVQVEIDNLINENMKYRL
jgi:hypothetical protein